MAEMHPDAVQYSIFERFLNRFLKDFERSDQHPILIQNSALGSLLFAKGGEYYILVRDRYQSLIFSMM
jgi:hypothetical protein